MGGPKYCTKDGKISREMREKLMVAASHTNIYTEIAEELGVDESTLHNWFKYVKGLKKAVDKAFVQTEKKHAGTKRPFFTDPLVNQFCKLMAEGLNQKDAAAIVGVNEHAICEWKKKHPGFAEKVEQAKLDFKVKALLTVKRLIDEADKDKTKLDAATWYLERKYPEEFAQHKVIRTDGTRSPLDILLGGDMNGQEGQEQETSKGTEESGEPESFGQEETGEEEQVSEETG